MTVIHTSPSDPFYNCIAWAAGDTNNWWWPNDYWPNEVPREDSLDAFIMAYSTMGYYPCAEEDMEIGFEKIAIYVENSEPRHAARQLPNGLWTSKLGKTEDVVHDLHELRAHVLQISGNLSDYGVVAIILKRPLFSDINIYIPF